MDKDLRVHVAAVGHEAPERIFKPLVDLRADRAHLITHETDTVEASKVLADVQSEIKKKLPSCELHIVRANIWSLESSLKEYRKIFAGGQGNHIYVNVSTGSRFVSIAGMLACMLWNGIPYYAKLDYSKKPNRVTETVFLPAYSIRQPENELLIVLEVLSQNNGAIRKRDLIKALQTSKIGLIPIYDQNVSKTAPHSKLRAYLEPLEWEWGFVSTKSKGRRSEITMTDKGRQALQIFGPATFPPAK